MTAISEVTVVVLKLLCVFLHSGEVCTTAISGVIVAVLKQCCFSSFSLLVKCEE